MGKSVFPFYRFHVEFVSPYLIKRTDMDEKALAERTLLINSIRATPLSERDVSSTWKCFAKNCDPEMISLTIGDIRKSYATIMLRRHREDKIGRGNSSSDFNQWLADVMNTSVNMIDTVYAASKWPQDI